MPAETMPESIGPYHVVGILGKGGMGSVYKAYKPPLKRYVAVKTIKAEFLATPGALERFRREAELSSQLKHPNIVTVYDYEEVQHGDSYIVTELIEGGITLRDRLQQGSLSLQEVSSILSQIASALDYAFETHNIVHRDIKPSNIFFEGGKRVALGDFGIAKDVSRNTQLTSLGEGVGTPDYMSPEQAMGDPLDRRSDVYSLGVVLFEMLTGTLPFKGDTPISVVMGHIQRPVPSLKSLNPDIPPAIEAVVTKALNKKKDDRYATAGDLGKAFEAAVKGVPVESSTIAMPFQGRGANSTLGMGSIPPASSPFITQELNVVNELERQMRHQEAFDRLYTLQSQFPSDSNITTRYQAYVAQGYVPSGRATGTGNVYGTGSVYPATGQMTAGYRPATPGPSQYTIQGGTASTGGGVIAPAKKSSLPLILGGVGVLVVAAVIVLIVLLSNSGGKGNNTPTAQSAITTGVTTAVTTSTTAATTTVAPTDTPSPANQAAQLNKDGEDLYNKGDYQGAVDKFVEAVRLAPGTALYHDNLAGAYNQIQEYNLAENEARLAVSLDPNVARYQNNLGVAVSALGKKSDAERAYREAVRLKPSEPLYHRNLASVLLDLNNYTEAETEARKAIALYTGDTSANNNDGLANAQNLLGESLEDQEKYVEAEAAYREALKLVPSSATYQLNVSYALFGQKKYADAEGEARKAVSLDSNNASAYNQMGLCQEFQNKFTDALNSYGKAVQLSPKTAVYQRNLGAIQYELKQYKESEATATTATQLDPNNARGFNILGNALFAQGRYKEALPNYQKAIDLSTSQNNPFSVYYSNLGLTYEQLADYSNARNAYQNALKVDPNNQDAKQGLDRIKNK